MSVLIACPIHNREWILPKYLEHIQNIDYDKNKISMYFLLNNCKDNSEKILKQFKKQNINKYNNIIIDRYNTQYKFEDNRTSEVRLSYTYHHLSELRNKIMRFASKNNYDWLLSCDSDILVPPDILNKLLSHNKDVISSLIYNGYIKDSDKPYKFPNILNYDRRGYKHIVNWYVKNSPFLKERKLIEVDATGAVVLMSHNIFNNKNIKYSFHPQGEDLYWSETVRNENYKLYCDLSVFSEHIMNKLFL